MKILFSLLLFVQFYFILYKWTICVNYSYKWSILKLNYFSMMHSFSCVWKELKNEFWNLIKICIKYLTLYLYYSVSFCTHALYIHRSHCFSTCYPLNYQSSSVYRTCSWQIITWVWIRGARFCKKIITKNHRYV